MMYDITADMIRRATQVDLDRFAAIQQAYGDMIGLARKIIERHEALMLQIRGNEIPLGEVRMLAAGVDVPSGWKRVAESIIQYVGPEK